MPRIALKLVTGLAAIVVLTVVAAGILAERSLRERALGELEASLLERARLVGVLLGERPLSRAGSLCPIPRLPDARAQRP